MIVTKDLLLELGINQEEAEAFGYLHINATEELTDDEIIEVIRSVQNFKEKRNSSL